MSLVPYRKPHVGTQPDYLHAAYVSSLGRAPLRPPISIPQTLSEITGPMFGREQSDVSQCDMTGGDHGEAQGQRISISGRVLDEDGRPVVNTLVEVWQANAAGRYLHKNDQHNAPLDPNFTGQGHTLTDNHGRYSFITIRPGSYPWGNHHNAWRPAHIHFSLFGSAVATRLVTQMYFSGDPMLEVDPIFNCINDEEAKQRLISKFDWETTLPSECLGFRFDLILRGRAATPFEAPRRHK